MFKKAATHVLFDRDLACCDIMIKIVSCFLTETDKDLQAAWCGINGKRFSILGCWDSSVVNFLNWAV